MSDESENSRPGERDALEARLVAWMLGEASAFEAAELERLVSAEPELGLFRRRLEAVHGLLGEAAALRRRESLRLAPERRAALVAKLGLAGAAAADSAGAESMPVMEATLHRRRSFGPAWKALRFYFGMTAACMLVFLVVYHLPVRFGGSIARYLGADEARVRRMEEERELRLKSVEEAKGEIENRRQARDWHMVEMAMPEVDESASDVAFAVARDAVQMMPAPTSAGAITVPVNRSVGASRVAAREPDAGSDEPETVPEGDENQRVELPLYEVKETSDLGYSASNTLAGSRVSTTLSDLGSAVQLSPFEVASDGAADGPRSESSYKFAQKPVDATDQRKDVNAVWTGEFDAFGGTSTSHADTGSAARPNPSQTGSVRGSTVYADGVSVVGPDYLRDLGATDNETFLQYAANSEASGVQGNFAGSNSIRAAAADPWMGGLADESRPPNSLLYGRDDPRARTRGLLGDERAIRGGGSRDAAAPPPAPVPPALADKKPKQADTKVVRETSAQPVLPAAIDEAHAATDPVSTFSLHVGDASFRLAQAALGRGELPDPAAIRPEEFYNAFDYGDAAPTLGEKVSCRIEQAAHPFLQQRALVRVAMKVAASGRGAGQPLHLTVLLDTSGSMEREDRVASVRRALEVLATLVNAGDQVTLIGFSRQPRLLAEALPGDQAGRLVDILAHTPADGGTNMEEALKLAGELAERHFDAAAQNRIVLLTDGAANLGSADPAQLATRVEAWRGHGIAFDACGVGTQGLDDEVLEALTRRGDGRYYVIDSPADADAGFARQLAGAFRPAAKNVKVQVRFNPARVGAYRLLGFEKHRLREQDFRNDAVDAAELASEEAAVALYQVEVLPDGDGELGEVYVRFRDTVSGRMVERSWTIAHEARLRSFDQASPGMQLAGVASLTAEVLRGGAIGDQVSLAELAPVVNRLRNHYATQPRVLELATMFEQLRRKLGR